MACSTCPGCSATAARALQPSNSMKVIVSRRRHSYSSDHMDPFLSLSFIQAVYPSAMQQIAVCLCKVSHQSTNLTANPFGNRHLNQNITSVALHQLQAQRCSLSCLPQDLASKYMRAALPAAQCKCGAVIVGTAQEDEYTCVCGRAGSIGHIKRSSDAQWIPHPFASCSANHTWNLLGTSGSVERYSSHFLHLAFGCLQRVTCCAQVQPHALQALSQVRRGNHQMRLRRRRSVQRPRACVPPHFSNSFSLFSPTSLSQAARTSAAIT